jgi:hypothetical protein
LECNGDLDNEIVATGAQFRSSATGRMFQLTGILDGSTLHKKLLLATAGFESLPGAVTPDFVMPANFFSHVPANDLITLNHAGHLLVDTQTILPANPLPSDGRFSRNYVEADSGTASGFVAINSPTNFAGQIGSVNLSSSQDLFGDYNDNDKVDAADFVVWRNNLGPFTIPNDPTSGSVTDEDYGVWRQNFANPGGGAGQVLAFAAAVPEPATNLLLLSAVVAVSRRRRRSYSF